MSHQEQTRAIADGIVLGVFKIAAIVVLVLVVVAGVGFVVGAVPSIADAMTNEPPAPRVDMAERARQFAPIAENQAREAQARQVAADLVARRQSTVCPADATRDQFQPWDDRRSYHPWRKN